MIYGKSKEFSKTTYKNALWDICCAYSPRPYASVISIKALITGGILLANAFAHHMKGLCSLNYTEFGGCVNVSVKTAKQQNLSVERLAMSHLIWL